MSDSGVERVVPDTSAQRLTQALMSVEGWLSAVGVASLNRAQITPVMANANRVVRRRFRSRADAA